MHERMNLMDYQELKNLTAVAEGMRGKEYRDLLQLVRVGSTIKDCFGSHLAKASSLESFYEAIYEDDDLRFEPAWGYWAKSRMKRWPMRFDEVDVFEIEAAVQPSFVLEVGGTHIAIPITGRGSICPAVYVFNDAAFNEKAADYLFSINGKFSIQGHDFEGPYDVFKACLSLVLQKWEYDEYLRRVNVRLDRGSIDY